MSDNRVVITGAGLVSALGHNVEEFWQACLNGKTNVTPVPATWANYYKSYSDVWSPLVLPDYATYDLSRADVLRNDTAVLNAIVASDDALDNAGLIKRPRDDRSRRYVLDDVDCNRSGVFIGTGLGCITSTFNNYVPHLLGSVGNELFSDIDQTATTSEHRELIDSLGNNPRVNPFASCQSMANSISASLSIRYGLRGASETNMYACAAGTAAIARAYRAIQHGELDIAVAGGSEYYGDRAGGVFMAFDRLRTLVAPNDEIDQGNRPFDKARSGFLFSQGGAGIVILESAAHAEARGGTALATIRGMSITTDANSLVAISEEENAIGLMFENVLRDGNLDAVNIDYINAHGTSTVQNDPIESNILANTFAHKPLVNSTKSLLGHTVGASGAIECIVTLLSMRDGKVHPSRNLVNPVADLNFATEPREASIAFALTHSFGFGGHNVGLLLQNAEV